MHLRQHPGDFEFSQNVDLQMYPRTASARAQTRPLSTAEKLEGGNKREDGKLLHRAMSEAYLHSSGSIVGII